MVRPLEAIGARRQVDSGHSETCARVSKSRVTAKSDGMSVEGPWSDVL